jgi:exosortase/archaeosortase family protein
VKIVSASQSEHVYAIGDLAALWKRSSNKMASAVVAGIVPWSALRIWPDLDVNVLARASAQFAALFMGCPVVRDELGWTLITAPVSSTVSAACSGADFLVVAAVVLAWRLASHGCGFASTFILTTLLAGPFSVLVNGTRIVAVTQMHRWVIPLFPSSCSAFLHLVTGVAVFLPALILLHATLPNLPALRHIGRE